MPKNQELPDRTPNPPKNSAKQANLAEQPQFSRQKPLQNISAGGAVIETS